MMREQEYTLIGNPTFHQKRIARKKVLLKKYTGIICYTTIVIFLTYYITSNQSSSDNDNAEVDTNRTYIHIPEDSKLFELTDFYPVNGNNTKGPITINRKKDNGKKVNLYEKMVNVTDNELENFYYDYETFDSLEDKLAMKDEYFCESQGYENEYEIKCPLYYHIVIDKSFYGRYARDLKHCTEGNDGEKIPKSNLLRIKNMVTKCGSDYTSYFKESCDGHENCRIFPSLSEFRDSCTDIYKYVHIKYHCEKDEEIKKPKFAIAMFANKIESNSIYENAISEFYQYTDIHNYKFFLNRVKYDNERSTFYMKINTLIEVVIQGLKTKACDWVLWVDGDVVLTNPNIKLEAFVPTDNDIHMLFGVDKNGFNAGVILMRVHSWTLNILMRAKSYQYYNKDRDLYYVDQSALNNVLVTDHEERHYMIIPKNWFNKYNFNEVQLVQRDLFNKNKVSLEPSDFIYHFAGLGDIKDKKANQLRNKVYNILYNDPNWSKEFTNKKLREEVLEYYENNKDVNNRQRLKLQN